MGRRKRRGAGSTGRTVPTVCAPDDLTIDARLQLRGGLDSDVVAEYADAYAAGDSLPPIRVVDTGECLLIVDGFHRHAAAKSALLSEIEIDAAEGTFEDALWEAAAANQAHGLRRTNADKRRAVLAALAHPAGAKKTTAALAKHCGVHRHTVENIRREMAAEKTPAAAAGPAEQEETPSRCRVTEPTPADCAPDRPADPPAAVLEAEEVDVVDPGEECPNWTPAADDPEDQAAGEPTPEQINTARFAVMAAFSDWEPSAATAAQIMLRALAERIGEWF